MAIDFDVKDILHKIQVKFIHTSLPEAKKPYNLKAVHQPELDIHEIASKAEVYNIGTSAKVIEEGLTAGLELIKYLAADGFKINTPLFKLRIGIPGEYDGSETRLNDGVYPVAHIQTSPALRMYLKEQVTIEFGGIDHAEGLIAGAYDEEAETTDETATIGKLLTVSGSGLKIEADEAHKKASGMFFEPLAGGEAAKVEIIAVNEPRTLKAIVPNSLNAGALYRIKVVTQGSARGSNHLLKEPREIRSEFSLAAQG
jgi:hypothetical protein